jgi:hypothetical protein
VVLVVLGGIIWWIYQQSKKQSEQQSQSQGKEQQKQEVSDTPASPGRKRAKDDLTVIEGIGPKVASVLQDAGITDFDSLSSADPAEVKNVLNEAGLQVMSPEGWIDLDSHPVSGLVCDHDCGGGWSAAGMRHSGIPHKWRIQLIRKTIPRNLTINNKCDLAAAGSHLLLTKEERFRQTHRTFMSLRALCV